MASEAPVNRQGHGSVSDPRRSAPDAGTMPSVRHAPERVNRSGKWRTSRTRAMEHDTRFWRSVAAGVPWMAVCELRLSIIQPLLLNGASYYVKLEQSSEAGKVATATGVMTGVQCGSFAECLSSI